MPKTILIVDDHADVRRLIRMTLETGDYELHDVGDAGAAIETARHVVPDLILLDVCMPGGPGGLELCRRWRADPALQATRIVMLTALDTRGDLKDGLDAGANAYMLKPFSPLQLMDLVHVECLAGAEVCR